MTLPFPVTACEMPEPASRKMGMPYSAARTGATRECSSCSCRPRSSTSMVGTIKLRPCLHQPVGDARIAQVVTDADADFAPGRIPDLLPWGRQTVLEKLDGRTLGLMENNFTVRADDKGGVVIIVGPHRVFAANNQIASMFAAPVLQGIRHRTVEGIFTQHKNLRVGIFGQDLVKRLGQTAGRGKFHRDAGDRQWRKKFFRPGDGSSEQKQHNHKRSNRHGNFGSQQNKHGHGRHGKYQKTDAIHSRPNETKPGRQGIPDVQPRNFR